MDSFLHDPNPEQDPFFKPQEKSHAGISSVSTPFTNFNSLDPCSWAPQLFPVQSSSASSSSEESSGSSSDSESESMDEEGESEVSESEFENKHSDN